MLLWVLLSKPPDDQRAAKPPFTRARQLQFSRVRVHDSDYEEARRKTILRGSMRSMLIFHQAYPGLGLA